MSDRHWHVTRQQIDDLARSLGVQRRANMQLTFSACVDAARELGKPVRHVTEGHKHPRVRAWARMALDEARLMAERSEQLGTDRGLYDSRRDNFRSRLPALLQVDGAQFSEEDFDGFSQWLNAPRFEPAEQSRLQSTAPAPAVGHVYAVTHEEQAHR